VPLHLIVLIAAKLTAAAILRTDFNEDYKLFIKMTCSGFIFSGYNPLIVV